MNASTLTDIVADQYARWRYPEPITDLPGWLDNNWQWFDPSHAHRLFWPDRDYWPGMDILVAGCGTNQAAVIAYNNPQARVLAVDVSQPSLEHQRFLKEKYALNNLELRQLPIEDLPAQGLDFDLIISTGVLHHLASPEAGMQALAACLRPHGVAAIMLYGKFGRLGVDMMQSVFRDLELGRTEASLGVVRDALSWLPQEHPLKSYLALAPDLHYDAGLVDTFLHGREKAYSMDECLALVQSAGLVFQDLFFKAPYFPPVDRAGPLQEALAALDGPRLWSVMERINSRNACHFFMACRSDRPQATYRIDWQTGFSSDYVPLLRFRCHLDGQRLNGPNTAMELDAMQTMLVQHIDGSRSIREIVQLLSESPALSGQERGGVEDAVKKMLRGLWQMDFVAFRLR